MKLILIAIFLLCCYLASVSAVLISGWPLNSSGGVDQSIKPTQFTKYTKRSGNIVAQPFYISRQGESFRPANYLELYLRVPKGQSDVCKIYLGVYTYNTTELGQFTGSADLIAAKAVVRSTFFSWGTVTVSQTGWNRFTFYSGVVFPGEERADRESVWFYWLGCEGTTSITYGSDKLGTSPTWRAVELQQNTTDTQNFNVVAKSAKDAFFGFYDYTVAQP